jgi:glutathione S-transferase
MAASLRVVGRTSSHFTRTVRIFALELDVVCELELVADLLSRDPEDYAGNPALRLPILETPEGNLYGTLNICRELSRRSAAKKRVVWPEDCSDISLANAQELTLQAMASEVTIVTGRLGGASSDSMHAVKLKDGIANSLSWLETRWSELRSALPAERDLSFLEVTVFCLFRHLAFREIVPLQPYPALEAFCREFERRPAVAATPYAFQA